MTPRKSAPRRKPRPKSRRRIALVLGGGGLKGFAHIGVLQALAERKIEPTVYAGTSIGALIGAAAVSGLSISEMKDRARALRRRDLFRLNRRGMLLQRTNAPSVYLSEPLREVCASVAPDVRFDELDTTLLVNTVELQRGSPLVWGLPGLRHVNVLDAVYASCALPGFFPPGIIEDRACVDGGVVDNLPVGVAGRGMQVVIAVDTGSSSIITQRDIAKHGFSAIYMRAATTMMHELQLSPLQNWAGPPMILIRPRVSHIGWFSFSRADELIEAGYLAAIEALELFDQCLLEDTGIFPRRELRITVDRDLCIGCTLCAALAPEVMAMDDAGKAFARTPIVEWSPADGEFVRHCPTAAISAAMLDASDPDNPPLALEPTGAGEPRARHPA